MIPSVARMLAAVVLAFFGLASPADAAGPATLKPAPPVAKGIAAFPHLVGKPGDQAVARINRALGQAEAGLGCDDPKYDWNRTVAVTMRGPHYLSYIAMDDYYCGGAYPDTDTVALVFALATGAPIDWKTLFPAGIVSAAGTGPGNPDSQPVTVTSDTLWKLYAKTAAAMLNDRQCAEVLNNPPWQGTGLMLWPDAAAEGIVMMAADFPHVVKACGPPVTLAMPEMRKLGVEPAFLADLAEAHRNGWFDKSKE
ncbi:MAG TPA: hypothetical protein VND87_05835 [Stellaceae bacterium]|nr:hypothetical protein [Stellaceae bacterium]